MIDHTKIATTKFYKRVLEKYPKHLIGLILANSMLYAFNSASLVEQCEYGYKLLNKDTTIASRNCDTLLAANAEVRNKLRKVHLAYKLLTDSMQTIIALGKIDSLNPRTIDFGLKILGPIIDKNKKMIYPEYFRNYTPLTVEINVPVLIINGTEDHAIGSNHYKLFNFPNQKTV